MRLADGDPGARGKGGAHDRHGSGPRRRLGANPLERLPALQGISPRTILRDRRLDGLKADLEAAGPSETVTSVATDWGIANLDAMAGAYRQRFGEPPSATLRRAYRKARRRFPSDCGQFLADRG